MSQFDAVISNPPWPTTEPGYEQVRRVDRNPVTGAMRVYYVWAYK